MGRYEDLFTDDDDDSSVDLTDPYEGQPDPPAPIDDGDDSFASDIAMLKSFKDKAVAEKAESDAAFQRQYREALGLDDAEYQESGWEQLASEVAGGGKSLSDMDEMVTLLKDAEARRAALAQPAEEEVEPEFWTEDLSTEEFNSLAKWIASGQSEEGWVKAWKRGRLPK